VGGTEKVWSLAFANDLVIEGKSARVEVWRKKNLEVNVEKTKMMVFNKRKRKSEENEWTGKKEK
jgi:hypothetical protein